MAEVLSPVFQSPSTINMVHSRPSSADAFQGSSSQSYQQSPRLGQAPRSVYNSQPNNAYRTSSATPVQPYAFQSTPQLRPDMRTSSASAVPQGPIGGHRQGHVNSTSTSTTSSSDTSSIPSDKSGAAGKEDSVIGSRPGSLINLSSAIPDLSLTSFGEAPAKSSPNRYRRAAQRSDSSNTVKVPSPQTSAAPSGSGMANVGHLYTQQAPPTPRTASSEDVSTKEKASELAKRYRRRSLNTLETQTPASPGAGTQASSPGTARPSSGHSDGRDVRSSSSTIRPVSHQRTPSGDSISSQRNASRTSSHKAESGADNVRTHENLKPLTPLTPANAPAISVPPRGSSDASKRLNASSPLARQTFDDEKQAPTQRKTYAAAAAGASSPAAQQLAALSDKDLNKGMKSRLRRAFSFGSAQELRKASAENNMASQPRRLHKEPTDQEAFDAEQEEVARRQEAAGIGAGIYSGQGGFTGSTDNLSISSTASSASMMLRKMGKGAKKSARSIKGLFRPKSVIGVPAADGPVQPSLAQVSMVTVEAERQKVNVNVHPTEHGGVTGFPKLERNSIDAASANIPSEARASADGSDSISRRSIVGSDKDRAEVLAAVKKGILKRSGTGSPSGSPVIRPTDANATPVPHAIESPASSMPNTPKDDRQGRSASFSNGNADYFSQRVTFSTKSMPNTPHGTARNISFSPRIQFHDAWSSTEYDRRGEIATCNRLTPMLAQQIKEELNTFKMVSSAIIHIY